MVIIAAGRRRGDSRHRQQQQQQQLLQEVLRKKGWCPNIDSAFNLPVWERFRQNPEYDSKSSSAKGSAWPGKITFDLKKTREKSMSNHAPKKKVRFLLRPMAKLSSSGLNQDQNTIKFNKTTRSCKDILRTE